MSGAGAQCLICYNFQPQMATPLFIWQVTNLIGTEVSTLNKKFAHPKYKKESYFNTRKTAPTFTLFHRSCTARCKSKFARGVVSLVNGCSATMPDRVSSRAARLGHSEVIALLLEELGELPAASAAMILDAKNNDTHTNETHTPLEVSRKKGHKDCESMLSAFRDGLRLASEANAK